MFVLDTNIVIAAMNGRREVVERRAGLEPGAVAVAHIVIAELLYGAYRSARRQENLAKVERMRSIFRVLPVSDAVIDCYARTRAALVDQRVAKSDFDLLIACTALVESATLVTDDRALLDGRIESLVVENWLHTSG